MTNQDKTAKRTTVPLNVRCPQFLPDFMLAKWDDEANFLHVLLIVFSTFLPWTHPDLWTMSNKYLWVYQSSHHVTVRPRSCGRRHEVATRNHLFVSICWVQILRGVKWSENIIKNGVWTFVASQFFLRVWPPWKTLFVNVCEILFRNICEVVFGGIIWNPPSTSHSSTGILFQVHVGTPNEKHKICEKQWPISR